MVLTNYHDNNTKTREDKKTELLQRWPRNALYIWVPCPETFQSPWVCPRYFSGNF